MDRLKQLQKRYENKHELTRKWKEETGGRVLGYFCTYVPEEILYAAGVLPVRILGSHEPQSVTESHIFGMFCPFCRDCLAQGLLGKYDYLDGLMIGLSCLHIRQTYSSWAEHIPMEFTYSLPVPQAVHSAPAFPYLRAHLVKFQKAVEEWTGRKIDDADLNRGIEIVNRNRKLMAEVYDLRKSDSPPLTGLESLYMVLSSQVGEKEAHSQLLEEALADELKGDRLPNRDFGTRLMLIGSEDDDADFIEMAEQAGSTIVCDDHCTGSRYFWGEVQPDSDPLSAIARRYLDRTPCPTKDFPKKRRFDRILELAKDFRVEGALVIQQKFCDPHECDKVALLDLLKKNDIKTLYLEFDVTTPLGPLRVRVDAFLETLMEDDLF